MPLRVWEILKNDQDESAFWEGEHPVVSRLLLLRQAWGLLM